MLQAIKEAMSIYMYNVPYVFTFIFLMMCVMDTMLNLGLAYKYEKLNLHTAILYAILSCIFDTLMSITIVLYIVMHIF